MLLVVAIIRISCSIDDYDNVHAKFSYTSQLSS